MSISDASEDVKKKIMQLGANQYDHRKVKKKDCDFKHGNTMQTNIFPKLQLVLFYYFYSAA